MFREGFFNLKSPCKKPTLIAGRAGMLKNGAFINISAFEAELINHKI